MVLADEMLTVPEIAKRLRVSLPSAYNLVGEGGIPHVRLSERRIRVPRSAFESWLLERTVGGPEQSETPERL